MEKKKTKQKVSKVAREFSSGGVIFKNAVTGQLFLISKSAKSKEYPKTRWRLPKGWVDETATHDNPGPISSGQTKATEEELQKTAIREVAEEGGINAEIIEKIGTERFFFNSKSRGVVLKFVTFYLMEWKSDRKEGFGNETSEIAWLPYQEARKILTHNGEKKILDKAKEILDSGTQPGLI